MPITIDRRSFLATLGGAALAGPLRAEPELLRRVHWALLSDTHVPEDAADTYRGFHPAENVVKTVGQVQQDRFDGYLINGDLARKDGLAGDYARLRNATAGLAEKSPLTLALGNHDDRKNAMAAFTTTAGVKEEVTDKWVSVIETGPLRMIVLDSLYQPPNPAGLLGKVQRDWLRGYLDTHKDRPTLVFVHHTLDDGDTSLLDGDRFLRILVGQPQVKAVFYGHSHVYKYERIGDLHLVNLPAVGYNFADDQPVGWVEAELTDRGARLTLHCIGGKQDQDGLSRRLDWRE